MDPEHISIKTVGENTKSTGQPDRRVGRNISPIGGGGATKGSALFTLALDAFIVGYDLWNTFSIQQDINAIEKQKMLLQLSFDAIDKYSDYIDPKYRNKNDFGAIVNFIFQA